MFVRDRAGNTEAKIARDVRHRRDQQQRIVHRHLYCVRDRRVGGPAVHVVDAEHIGQEQRVEFAALEELRQFDPVVERVVAIGTIARMCPQPGRLMPDTVPVEGVEADLLWHLVPLAPAGCGTYTVGHYGLSNGIRTRWTRMNCARYRHAEEAVSGAARNRIHPGAR